MVSADRISVNLKISQTFSNSFKQSQKINQVRGEVLRIPKMSAETPELQKEKADRTRTGSFPHPTSVFTVAAGCSGSFDGA